MKQIEFSYIARDFQGKQVKGSLLAGNKLLVIQELKRQGLQPVRMSEVPQPHIWRRLKSLDIEQFFRQGAHLLKSGIPLIESLEIILEHKAQTQIGKVINSLRKNVDSGQTLSIAMSKHPEAFNNVAINAIKAGEEQGRLDTAMTRIAKFMAFQRETKAMIWKSLRYPMIVMGMIFLLLVGFSWYVMPVMEKTYSQWGAQLPFLTILLMNVASFLKPAIPLSILGACTLIPAFKRYINTKSGRIHIDRLLLKIPVIGKLLNLICLSRFCNVLSSMDNAGINITQAIRLSIDSVGNKYIESKLEPIVHLLESGQSISKALQSTESFDTASISMIYSGEKSGRVNEALTYLSDHYFELVDERLKELPHQLETFLIITSGAAVLILSLGLMMPFWNLASAAMSHYQN